jgi:hypothetical protein
MTTAPVQITHGGVTYRSMAALARALGLSRQRVHQAYRCGTMHTLGAGSARLAGQQRCQPVAAHGFWWPSQKAAAADLGVPQSRVCRALQDGRFEDLVAVVKGVSR